MSIAATVIYAYAWLVPLALWGFLVWRNSKVMNIVSYSLLEIVCVYGYSLFIYIPTAVSATLHPVLPVLMIHSGSIIYDHNFRTDEHLPIQRFDLNGAFAVGVILQGFVGMLEQSITFCLWWCLSLAVD